MFPYPFPKMSLAILLSSVLPLLTSCGGGVGGAQSNVSVNPKATKQVIVNPQALTLPKGDSSPLSAIAVANDGTRQDVTSSAAWSVSPSGLASVSGTGQLTAAATGGAQVSAQYQGVTGKSSVTVLPAALVSIAVSPSQSSLPVGESAQFSATGTFSDASSADLTQVVTWNSSLSGVASVNPSGATVANSVGTATIGATSGSVTGSALVTVIPAAVISLAVVPNTTSIALGGTRQFQAIATFSDGSTQDMTGTVLWTSAQSGVANINSGGLALAQQVGTTTVSAAGGTVSGIASITVVPLITINYFDLASAQQSGADGTIRFTNPGLTNGNLCAMIYVFDEKQEMSECCGCSVSDSGLRTLSLVADLTSNPLIGVPPPRGVLKIVPSDPASNPQCDPGSLTPSGMILAWGSNAQTQPDGTPQITESNFDLAPLSDGEASALVSDCTYLRQLGSGQGTCSCGSGD
jgi:hypothetical protein